MTIFQRYFFFVWMAGPLPTDSGFGLQLASPVAASPPISTDLTKSLRFMDCEFATKISIAIQFTSMV